MDDRDKAEIVVHPMSGGRVKITVRAVEGSSSTYIILSPRNAARIRDKLIALTKETK